MMRRHPRPLALATLAGLAATLAPSSAHAHLIGVRFGDFYGGALHLLLSVEQVAAVVLLALLAGLQPRAAARWLVPALPLGLAVGAIAARPLDLGELPLASGPLLLLAGVATALALRLNGWLIGVAGLLAGAVLGYRNGVGLEDGIDPRLFVAGVATAGFVLATLIAAATVALTAARPWARIAVRTLGSWGAAAGCILTGLAFTTPTPAAMPPLPSTSTAEPAR